MELGQHYIAAVHERQCAFSFPFPIQAVGITGVLVQQKAEVCLLLISEPALLAASKVEGLIVAPGLVPVGWSLSLQLAAQQPGG